MLFLITYVTVYFGVTMTNDLHGEMVLAFWHNLMGS
jgi:hypothetical protein